MIKGTTKPTKRGKPMFELFREMRKIPARDWLLYAFNLVAAWALLVFWLVAVG